MSTSSKMILDADPRVADLSGQAANSNFSADTYWFAAATKLGLVHVGIESLGDEQSEARKANKVFLHAALLSQVELLVQVLEDWQGIDLDLAPAQQPIDSTLTVRMRLKAESSVSPIYVVFETSALAMLADISSSTEQQISFDSLSVMLNLCLESVFVTTDEYQMISEGAMILLPSSFESVWSADALTMTPDKHKATRVVIDRTSHSLSLLHGGSVLDTAMQHPKSDDEIQPSTVSNKAELVITLNETISIPLASMLSAESSGFQLPLTLNNAPVTITSKGRAIATGVLCEVGNGCGVVIVELIEGGTN